VLEPSYWVASAHLLRLSRALDIVPELADHLWRFADPQPNGLVFIGPKGGRLRRSDFRKFWYQAREAVGLPDLHFHDYADRCVARELAGVATTQVGGIPAEGNGDGDQFGPPAYSPPSPRPVQHHRQTFAVLVAPRATWIVLSGTLNA
jgi:hypothetical protein